MSEFKRYESEAKERWGETQAYKEYEKKAKEYDDDKISNLADGMNEIMKEFAQLMKHGEEPSSDEAQSLSRKLQAYITENFYTCTKEILFCLGQMYTGDERFKANIDKHGEGTAEFIKRAIEVYCE